MASSISLAIQKRVRMTPIHHLHARLSGIVAFCLIMSAFAASIPSAIAQSDDAPRKPSSVAVDAAVKEAVDWAPQAVSA